MTAENLLQFLQHPQNLRRVSYQELKTLALEYPYSTHIHQLLLLKSKLSDQKDFSIDLARAAASSPDRNHLRQRLLEFEQALKAAAHSREEVFELKPPAEVEELLAGIRSTQVSPAKEDNVPSRVLESPPPQPEILSPASTQSQIPAENPSTENPIDEASPTTEIPSQEEDQGYEPEPLDKSAFKSWNLQHRQVIFRPHVSAATLKKTSGPVLPPPPSEPISGAPNQEERVAESPADLHHLAEVSIEEKQEVASETLAALLVRQGNLQKAIEMYQRLILKFPEKSAFFVAQIENLKK